MVTGHPQISGNFLGGFQAIRSLRPCLPIVFLSESHLSFCGSFYWFIETCRRKGRGYRLFTLGCLNFAVSCIGILGLLLWSPCLLQMFRWVSIGNDIVQDKCLVPCCYLALPLSPKTHTGGGWCVSGEGAILEHCPWSFLLLTWEGRHLESQPANVGSGGRADTPGSHQLRAVSAGKVLGVLKHHSQSLNSSATLLGNSNSHLGAVPARNAASCGECG